MYLLLKLQLNHMHLVHFPGLNSVEIELACILCIIYLFNAFLIVRVHLQITLEIQDYMQFNE